MVIQSRTAENQGNMAVMPYMFITYRISPEHKAGQQRARHGQAANCEYQDQAVRNGKPGMNNSRDDHHLQIERRGGW